MTKLNCKDCKNKGKILSACMGCPNQNNALIEMANGRDRRIDQFTAHVFKCMVLEKTNKIEEDLERHLTKLTDLEIMSTKILDRKFIDSPTQVNNSGSYQLESGKESIYYISNKKDNMTYKCTKLVFNDSSSRFIVDEIY